MHLQRFSKFLLVVLALALWASTAMAQPTAVLTSDGVTPVTSVYLTYVTGGTGNVIASPAITVSPGAGDNLTGTDNYTATIAYTGGSGSWLTAAGSGTLPDTTLVLTLATPPAAGAYSATVTLADTSSSTTGAAINVYLVVAPLSVTGTPSLTLSYVTAAGGAQAATAQTTVTVNSVDTNNYDPYTVAAPNCAWLTLTGNPTTLQAEKNHSDVLTIAMDPTKLPTTATSTTVNNCVVTLSYNNVAFDTISFTSLTVMAQPVIVTAAPSAVLGYSRSSGASGPATTTFSIGVAHGTANTLVTFDTSTLPAWAQVNSGLTSNATTVGGGANSTDAITMGINTNVAAGLPAGNYVGNLGFYAPGMQSSELIVSITLQVSNSTPTISANPTAETYQPFTWTSSTPVPPVPTVALYSTNEPTQFTATCTVSGSAYGSYAASTGFATPCILNGAPSSSATNIVNGTTFTWGYGLNATLDPSLFAVGIGNTIIVTFHFSGTSQTAPNDVLYQYTVQPGAATATATPSPSSVAADFSKSAELVVTIKGTNFIGTSNIAAAGAIKQTQVWVSGVQITTQNTATVGSYVVVDSGHIALTLPAGSIPVPATGKTTPIVIGVGNQSLSTPAVSQATTTLTVTWNPVIYGITDTASYMVQPSTTANPNPGFAPFELISIFGDNFGITSPNIATATFDADGKAGIPLTVVAANGTVKAVTMKVAFTTTDGKTAFQAPVLFANASQINAIVPSGLTAGTTYNVTVTVSNAGAASDNFPITAVPANPGIFTLSSDGMGTGAIVDTTRGVVNASGAANKALPSDNVSIYLTGLGFPDSTSADATPGDYTQIGIPGACVSVSGLLQVVNTTVKVGSTTTYASPGWTSLDGAEMKDGPNAIIEGTGNDLNFPPCFTPSEVTVTFGTVTNNVQGTVTFAGFVTGAVAGLYQINVSIPASLTPSGGTPLSGKTPITVNITPAGNNSSTYPSQSGVVIYF
jgi:uncharacterized protein (TIGR03437 family)